MAVGQKTNEVSSVAGLTLASDFIGNQDQGTARFFVSDIPQLTSRSITVASGTDLDISEASHFMAHLNIDNSAGAVAITLPNADTVLENQQDAGGSTVNRGGFFCVFTIASPDFPVSFVAGSGATIRATGNAFQGSAFTASPIYVGGNQQSSDEATVFLFKRGGLWVLQCSQGWRTDEDADALVVSGAQAAKEISEVSSSNREITDADHQKPIWLTAATPGTLTLADALTEGLQTTIINQGGATAVIDFSGHTQVGSVNAIGVNEAGTLIVGPLVSGTNRNIILKASS